MTLQARALKLMARVGRRVTGYAYRKLRDLELARNGHDDGRDHRFGSAGGPSRAAGGPGPHPSR